jgi:hypothetical protein
MEKLAIGSRKIYISSPNSRKVPVFFTRKRANSCDAVKETKAHDFHFNNYKIQGI